MKISELREILYELQYEQGDLDVYAMVTRDSGYLLDCHNATYSDPSILTGEDYTLVYENTDGASRQLTDFDGFSQEK